MTPPCVPKFSPSPCPTHYDERLATTTSADFCSITQSVSAPVRCLKIGRVLWLPCRFQQHLIQTPMDSRLLFEQISPDKNVNCLCTTAPFTVSLEPEGFVVVCQLAPKISAFYDGSVRRLTDLPPASSGHSLASLPLLLASGCRHSAPITFEHLDAGSTTGDFHPMSVRPAWAYTPMHPTVDRLSVSVQGCLRRVIGNVNWLRFRVRAYRRVTWLSCLRWFLQFWYNQGITEEWELSLRSL